jgi:hypothetical protein
MKFLTNTSLKAFAGTAAALMIIAAPSAQAGACDTICSGIAQGVIQYQMYTGMEAAKTFCDLSAQASVAQDIGNALFGRGSAGAGMAYGNYYAACMDQQQKYTQTIAEAAGARAYSGCMSTYICS